jgi:hypothetical protein
MRNIPYAKLVPLRAFSEKTDLINEYAKNRRPFPAQDAQSDAFRTPMQQHCCQDNIRC